MVITLTVLRSPEFVLGSIFAGLVVFVICSWGRSLYFFLSRLTAILARLWRSQKIQDVVEKDSHQVPVSSRRNKNLPNLSPLWSEDECEDGHEVEIIAVHGLGANPYTTWCTKRNVNWLSDPRMLPSKVSEARIWTFNFESDLFGEAPLQRLSTLGDQLLEIVVQKLGNGRRPIIFVAHSFGGIVVAEALCSAASEKKKANDVLNLITGAVFLGTPFRPSPATKLGKFFVSTRELFGFQSSDSKQLLDDLTASQKMLDLSNRFERLAVDTKLDVFCFFEQVRMPFINKPPRWLRWVRRFNIMVVPEEMACLSAFPRLGLATSHTHMNEYDDPEDGNYQYVSRKLAEFADNSLKIRGMRRGVDSKATIFSMPYPQNPRFTGRKSLLKEVRRKMLWREDEGIQVRVALYGLGGIGKTQIAIKYAYSIRDRLASEGVSLFWIHGATKEQFEASYLRLAKRAQISIENTEDRMLRVTEWLQNESNGRWLMIIDNIDDIGIFNNILSDDGERVAEVGWSKYIPNCAHGTILFTSRDIGACVDLVGPSPNTLVQVEKMDMEDCRLLFKQALARDRGEESADHLIVLLECLPLALSQAISYMVKQNVSIGKYLEMYLASETASIELLGKHFQADGRDAVPNAVALTWIMSFKQIEAKHGLAARLLKFMSFFDHQDIPKKLLQVVEWTGLEFEDAMGTLQGFSMIMPNSNEGYDMHRLVKLAMRHWLKRNTEAHKWACYATSHLDESFPDAHFRNWQECARYLPHAQSILDYTLSNPTALDPWWEEYEQKEGSPLNWRRHEASLLLSVGWYVLEKGNFSKAEACNSRALKICHEFLAADDYLTIRVIHSLGVAYTTLGKWPEAVEIFENVVETLKRTSKRDALELLAALHSLAAAYIAQRRFEEAEKILVESLDHLRNKCDVEHHYTLDVMGHLSSTLQSLGELEEAERLLVETLNASIDLLGPEDPSTLIFKMNLGGLYRELGLYAEASRMLSETWAVQKRVIGPEHPDTLSTRSSLASVYEEESSWGYAAMVNVQVLEARKRVLGNDHENTIESMCKLAKNWKHLGRYHDAVSLMSDALELRERTAGTQDRRALGYASILTDWKEHAEAWELIPYTSWGGLPPLADNEL